MFMSKKSRYGTKPNRSIANAWYIIIGRSCRIRQSSDRQATKPTSARNGSTNTTKSAALATFARRSGEGGVMIATPTPPGASRARGDPAHGHRRHELHAVFRPVQAELD